jgi:hypothetical protein
VAHTHEVPNHLNVEDTLFLGLSARQVATFMAFASPAYGVWDQLTVVPLAARGALAGLLFLAGILFTILQPGNRPLDEWMFAVLAYAVTPRRLRWYRPEPDAAEWRLAGQSGWADLTPSLGWSSPADPGQEASS